MMESLNKLINQNNQVILFDIANQLENIASNLLGMGDIDCAIKQIKNIIFILNKLNNDTQKNFEAIRNDIKQLNKNVSNNFKLLLSNKSKNNKDIFETKTENYSGGDKYIGQLKNGIREGKGIYYYANGAKYEGDFKNGLAEGKGSMD